MNQYYIYKNIRLLLSAGFVKDQLLDLCFDTPDLREIYENLSNISNKSELIRQLIDFADKQVMLDQVLEWAKDVNRIQYDNYKPYYGEDDPEKAFIGVGHVLPDNSLGKGILLGGSFREVPLRLVATEWVEYGQSGWVRSGWLFIPQRTENHATTFFKIHANRDHKGYIHIADASSPSHPVWLITSAGNKIEKEFHYIGYPSDIWHFVW